MISLKRASQLWHSRLSRHTSHTRGTERGEDQASPRQIIGLYCLACRHWTMGSELEIARRQRDRHERENSGHIVALEKMAVEAFV